MDNNIYDLLEEASLRQENNQSPIDWRELIEKVLEYWKWIVLCVVVALITGYLYNRKQTDLYSIKTSMLLQDQSKSSGMNEMSLLRQLEGAGLRSGTNYSFLNNENAVLRSSLLMKNVVNQLELYTDYTTARFLKKKDLYTSSPLLLTIDSVSLNKLKDLLILKVTPDGKGYGVEGEYDGTDFEQHVSSLPAEIKTPAGVVFLNARAGAEKTKETITITVRNPAATAKYYANTVLKTDLNNKDKVDVIDLSVSVSNVQKGKDILNTLINDYNQDAIDQVNKSANNTAMFIDSRLQIIYGELSDEEKRVENYKQSNNMTNVESDVALYLQQGDRFNQELMEVETQLKLIRFVEDFIKDPANNSSPIPNLGVKDNGLTSVIQEYNQAIITRERIAAGSSAENPVLRDLNKQIELGRNAIRTTIANNRRGLEISRRDYSSRNSEAQARINALPRQEREFLDIKRQQQVKESLYVFLLQKREEASLTMAVTVPKGRVLDNPDYAGKIAPNSKMIMLVFFMLGLLLPLAFIFLKDMLQTKLTTRKQVEKMTDVPVLSELSHNTTGLRVIDHRAFNDSNVELFRLLRTKLNFVLQQPTQKVVTVTSTEPGEGKSYVAINLAINLSLSQKKVILLGADIRKPQLKNYLKMNLVDLGLTSFFSGQVNDYHTLINSLEDYPDLHVIIGGIVPPNPNELLMSDRLDFLITELRKEYDYIILDTAPVGVVSDTFVINRVSDISLYVFRMNYSDKRNIDYLNHVVDDKTLTRPYIVLNDLDIEAKYSYRKGYGYGYGYYYGHNKLKEQTE
ncbi:MAG: capsular exopolysaccharide family [Bacteroidetes bacterium]|nr:capsular exopolysaccharide family [Bacteroidota bacterium]